MILALGVIIFVIGYCLSFYTELEDQMTIREFVKRSIEYDHYRKRGTWGKYTVYYVWNKAWEGAKIGYPHFALVDGENIRIANHNETMKIMGL